MTTQVTEPFSPDDYPYVVRTQADARRYDGWRAFLRVVQRLSVEETDGYLATNFHLLTGDAPPLDPSVDADGDPHGWALLRILAEPFRI